MSTKTINPIDSQAQALCLAVFRICYGSVLFLEVCHIFYFRHLLFDKVPYLDPAPSLLYVLLTAWLINIVCVILGYRTTLSCFLNYVFSVIFLGKLLYPLFEYHVDYVYVGVNFLLFLAPVGDRLSLDASRQKRTTATVAPRNYAIFINCIIFLGIALVYADSIFFKFSSPMWSNGLGVWLPASLPQNSWFSVPQVLLDQKWLMLFLGYLTLIFETTFPVLMWWRPVRPVLLVIGAGLHLSIGLVFPIPFFGLTYLGLYLLLVPLSFWRHLDRKLFYPGIEMPSHLSSAEQNLSTNQAAWTWREKITLATACLASVLQTTIIVARHHDLPERIQPVVLRPFISLVHDSCVKLQMNLKQYPRMFGGITDHAVFMDTHFQKFSRIYAITAIQPDSSEVYLPAMTSNGTPGSYITGRLWVWWNWRVTGPISSPKSVASGLARTTAFWINQDTKLRSNVEFHILSRPVKTPTQWEKGYLQEQLKSEWKLIGTGKWQQGQFTITPVKKE